MKQQSYSFQFVEFVPKVLEDGVLYVSMTYATASHRCFCGCSMKVVTPLSPTDWRLTFDGDSLSLHPSIGNWSYPCRSHYILRDNHVVWAGPISSADILAIRNTDVQDKRRYYNRHQRAQSSTTLMAVTSSTKKDTRRGWRRALDWFRI